MGGTASSRYAWLSLLAVLAGALAVPLGLRAVNTAIRSPEARPSYIPSIESPRAGRPFDDDAVHALREAANDYVLIGDSMAGTRIDPGHLSRLLGGRGAAALSIRDRGRPTGTWPSRTSSSPPACIRGR